jgi:predicted dehydrogenase
VLQSQLNTKDFQEFFMASGTTDKVRIGVIGVGIGQAHLKGYAQVPQAQVVALCDINEERARQVARDCSVPDADILTDYRALLDRSDIDAVSVCLPNVLHRPVAVDALQAGKHVICEKPLSISAPEAQLIADAADAAGKKCMVAQVKRFGSEGRFLKQRVEEGELGRIYYAQAVWLRKRGIPGYGGWFTTKAMSGGGPLIDIGVHLLDAAWWLAGCPKPVAAMGATYAEFGPHGKGAGGWGVEKNTGGTFDVEDLAVGLIRFDNGLTINLEVSWALHNKRENQGVSLYGQRGGCEWTNEVSLFRDEAGAPVNSRVELPRSDAWAAEMGHFVDCVLNDKTPDPDAHQGVTMMKMLDAIYRSAETGAEVRID